MTTPLWTREQVVALVAEVAMRAHEESRTLYSGTEIQQLAENHVPQHPLVAMRKRSVKLPSGVALEFHMQSEELGQLFHVTLATGYRNSCSMTVRSILNHYCSDAETVRAIEIMMDLAQEPTEPATAPCVGLSEVAGYVVRTIEGSHHTTYFRRYPDDGLDDRREAAIHAASMIGGTVHVMLDGGELASGART